MGRNEFGGKRLNRFLKILLAFFIVKSYLKGRVEKVFNNLIEYKSFLFSTTFILIEKSV